MSVHKKAAKNTQPKVLEKIASWQHALLSILPASEWKWKSAKIAANGRPAASSLFAAEAHVRQSLPENRAAQKTTEKIWNLKSAKVN